MYLPKQPATFCDVAPTYSELEGFRARTKALILRVGDTLHRSGHKHHYRRWLNDEPVKESFKGHIQKLMPDGQYYTFTQDGTVVAITTNPYPFSNTKLIERTNIQYETNGLLADMMIVNKYRYLPHWMDSVLSDDCPSYMKAIALYYRLEDEYNQQRGFTSNVKPEVFFYYDTQYFDKYYKLHWHLQKEYGALHHKNRNKRGF